MSIKAGFCITYCAHFTVNMCTILVLYSCLQQLYLLQLAGMLIFKSYTSRRNAIQIISYGARSSTRRRPRERRSWILSLTMATYSLMTGSQQTRTTTGTSVECSKEALIKSLNNHSKLSEHWWSTLLACFQCESGAVALVPRGGRGPRQAGAGARAHHQWGQAPTHAHHWRIRYVRMNCNLVKSVCLE